MMSATLATMRSLKIGEMWSAVTKEAELTSAYAAKDWGIFGSRGNIWSTSESRARVLTSLALEIDT